MADKRQAITKTLRNEGYVFGKSTGYVFDPDDRGGETIGGVAKKFHQDSKIWLIVDAAKKLPGFPSSLSKNKELYELLIEVYASQYWDKIGGDLIKDQETAENLYDSAVLEGVSAAIRREEKIAHLPETGKISGALIEKLNSLI